MSMEILIQNNPVLADLVSRWKSKYERSYDLSSVLDQADFYEGVMEITRHMAAASSTGRMELSVNPNGPCTLNLNVVPLN